MKTSTNYDDMLKVLFVLAALLVVACIIILYMIVELQDVKDRAENLLSNMLYAEQQASFWQAEALENEQWFRGEQRKLKIVMESIIKLENAEIENEGRVQCGWDMCLCADSPQLDPEQERICEEAGFNAIYAMQIVCNADENCRNCLSQTTGADVPVGDAVSFCYRNAYWVQVDK